MRGAAFAALVLAMFLGACAAPQTRALIEAPGALPSQAEIASAPFFPQDRYRCGPATIAMALVWTGEPVTPVRMVAEVYTPGREGTFAHDMVTAARHHGRLAVPVGNLRDLLSEIAAGHPVIVFQNLGLDLIPQWHFALAVGYDLHDGTIVLRSGQEKRRVIGLATFERTWARTGHWALLVLPPDHLPATADVRSAAGAAAGLESAGRPEAARHAYRAIVARWPGSLAGWIGLGNANHALGDLAAAESAFQSAAERHPGNAVALNNLAFVLGQRGRTEEAIAIARRAVSLAKGDRRPYLETLRDLMNARQTNENSKISETPTAANAR